MNTFAFKAAAILILIFSHQALQAQKFGNILKNATKKLEKGVSDILEEKITDKIVDIALDEINGELDSVFQEAYEADSKAGGSSRSYGEFLGGMDESDKVSESYTFDLSHKLKDIGPDGKEVYCTQYYTKDGTAFGMESENTFIIIDSENGIMITCNTEDKSAFAFGKKLIQYSKGVVPNDFLPGMDMKAASGNKEILGYSCDKYTSETEDANYDLYITDGYPDSMENPYKIVAEVFMETQLEESFKEINGLVLESIRTEANGDVTHSTVVAIDKSPFTLKKSDYNFGGK